MARINLLPWRLEKRKQKQQEFFVMVGAFALFAAIIVAPCPSPYEIAKPASPAAIILKSIPMHHIIPPAIPIMCSFGFPS